MPPGRFSKNPVVDRALEHSIHDGNLLHLFLLSGAIRAVVAALLARRLRDFRKPRKR